MSRGKFTDVLPCLTGACNKKKDQHVFTFSFVLYHAFFQSFLHLNKIEFQKDNNSANSYLWLHSLNCCYLPTFFFFSSLSEKYQSKLNNFNLLVNSPKFLLLSGYHIKNLLYWIGITSFQGNIYSNLKDIETTRKSILLFFSDSIIFEELFQTQSYISSLIHFCQNQALEIKNCVNGVRIKIEIEAVIGKESENEKKKMIEEEKDVKLMKIEYFDQHHYYPQTQRQIKCIDKRRSVNEKGKSKKRGDKKYFNLREITHSFHEGTLTISGDGDIPDSNGGDRPWRSLAESIRKVIIEEPITSVGSSSFSLYYTKIESVEIANSVLKINQYAFTGCENLTSLNLSDHLTQIDDYAFWFCSNLTSLILPNSLTQTGMYVFSQCLSLRLLVLPNNLALIGEGAFNFCTNLTSLSLPNNFPSISVYCFANCNALTSLIIPVGVTTLESYAFMRCNHLESVNISHTVTTIDDYAFIGCDELACVYYDGTTDPGNGNLYVFDSTKIETIRVSTNYGNGTIFCGKPTEIGASCIRIHSKSFSQTIKSAQSSSILIKFSILMMRIH